ncbi:helix-turn-helix transcriptional regulator [Paenibacillus sp. MY03]|uniref:helix-turn-helix transcriptional regulator n=1 Tax=Paenibacillus sp. MY03 TaxID=302980 RepID=UPI0015C67F58|nr:AraC family transcriptional regulator [Paenibacillus sp. MY03]
MNLALSVYYDDDLAPFIYRSSTEDLVRKSSKLVKIVSTYSFLNSIVYYNGPNGEFYTDNARNSTVDNEVLFDKIGQYLHGDLKPAKMQFIPVSYAFGEDSGSGGQVDSISFFMYEGSEYKAGESALVLNINPNWFLENISGLYDDYSNTAIYLGKGEREIVSFSPNEKPLYQELYSLVSEHRLKTGRNVDYFVAHHDNKKQIITYRIASNSNWDIINVQPYDDISRHLNKLKYGSIVILGLFILLSFVASILIAQKLYRPIDTLVKQFKSPESDRHQESKDEFGWIMSSYKGTLNHLQLIQNERAAQVNIVKQYQLRRLISDSPAYRLADYTECISQHQLNLSPNGNIILAVLKLDNHRTLGINLSLSQRRLYQFAVLNIVEEILSKDLLCESVEMRSEHLVILMSTKDGIFKESDYSLIISLISSAQKVVNELYKVTFSAAISEPSGDYINLSTQYNQAQQYLDYRIVHGNSSILTYDLVKTNINSEELVLPLDLEKKFSESIKAEKPDLIEDYLEQLLERIAGFRYDNMMYAMLRLVVLIGQAIKEINMNRIQPIQFDLNALNLQLLEQETLEDCKRVLLQPLDRMSAVHAGNSVKYDILVDTIKDFVQQNYMDSNLNVQSIASALKMSSVYIGKIFKNSEGASMIDYLNDVRLEQALHMLKSTDFNITEIMERAGYGNQSYFFRLFKRKYGVTPKEYRLKGQMDQWTNGHADK